MCKDARSNDTEMFKILWCICAEIVNIYSKISFPKSQNVGILECRHMVHGIRIGNWNTWNPIAGGVWISIRR